MKHRGIVGRPPIFIFDYFWLIYNSLGKLHYLWDEGGGIRRSGQNFLDARFVVGEFFWRYVL